MKFNCKNLQECYELTAPILNNINQIKDCVSEDIKSVEKYLKSIQLPESISYIISDPEESFEPLAHDEFKLITSASCIEEILTWDHVKKRLMFSQNLYVGIIHHEVSETPTIDRDSRNEIINKPLIETPFEIRKHVYANNYLIEFLKNIARKYDMSKQIN